MKFDIIIVGAGLAGASLACALRGSRYRIALLERALPSKFVGNEQDWDARIYALSPASVAFLESIKVWPRLDAARIAPIEQIQVYGDVGGHLSFSAYDSGLAALASIVESRQIAAELWETASRQANIEVICPAEPDRLTIHATAAQLSLADGRVLEADLIIAADGARSWVREQAGIAVQGGPYGEDGVVANFECSRPHNGTACQWFRSDGVLAWLPLPDNRMSMVWSTPHDHAEELLSLSPAELCRRVSEAGGRALGELRLITPPAAFPLARMEAKTIVQPRLALVGDAGHVIHPLSGHGINLGFQDARELAELLSALPAFRNCGELSVLRRYARARAEEVKMIQGLTHALNHLFRLRAAPIALMRNIGMNFTNRIPGIRSMLVRYASGLT